MAYNDDQFFRDEDELQEWCADNEADPETLMLVICEPNYLTTIDTDHWANIMPDDGDGELPKEVEEALVVFNAVIAKQGPISYGEGQYRTTIKKVED